MIGNAETLISTAGWTSDDWSAYRGKMTTIGASDAYKILYGARLEWVMQRRGTLPRFQGNDLTRLGTGAEPITLELLAERLGRPVQAAHCVVMHPTIHSLHASPDGLVASGSGGIDLVECKWTKYGADNARMLHEHGPEAVMGTGVFGHWLQAQHQLAVTGLARCWLAYLLGAEALALALLGHEVPRDSFLAIPVLRDPDMIGVLERELPAFHARYVATTDDLPAPNANAAGDLKAIGKAYRVAEGLEVDLPDMLPEVQRYAANREAERDAKKAKDADKARILGAMGEAAAANVPGFSVKRSKRGSLLIKERGNK